MGQPGETGAPWIVRERYELAARSRARSTVFHIIVQLNSCYYRVRKERAMASEEFTYRPQDVNYLGFLEAQLRDMQGINTLAYELIQNADDVVIEAGQPQATWMSFDVTDQALVVENNGVFRQVDFERLQNIASGGKREESGTTGAFGLGFIAVYQITDRPEILSNNRHWIIRPDAAPERRIQERALATEGTQFILPWSFDERSQVRRTLRIEAIQLEQLPAFVDAISEAIELAALFLKQLQRLEVKHNGILVKRIERLTQDDDRIILRDAQGRSKTWLLYHKDFEAEADRLKETYRWQIEASRRSQVRLAMPAESFGRQGRLFAVLPTDSATPLPFHINADFYPTTDRKRIHFGSGYQAEWNRAAIRCAAQAVRGHLDALPAQLGPQGLWHLLQKLADVGQMAEQGELPPIFGSFWEEAAPLLAEKPIVFTSQEEWRLPAEARMLARGTSHLDLDLLQSLGLPLVHPELAPHFGLMARPEIGVGDLTIEDIAGSLIALGLDKPTPLYAAPPFLRELGAWSKLWELMDDRLSRTYQPEARQRALQALAHCAVVVTDQMTLQPLRQVFRGKAEARALFPELAWLHDAVGSRGFPGQYVPDFGVRQAVDLLAQMGPDQLERSWQLGKLDLPALFRWFESGQIEIFADDPGLQREICRLPLCPVAGELRPLAQLYIPGGFDDPLGISGFVDLEAIGGRRQFLRDLGVQELDFDTYVHSQMPRVLENNLDIASDARHRLSRLLAERLGELRDDSDLQEVLSRLPLVACMDGSFRPGLHSYASRSAVTLLGGRVHVAEPVTDSALAALHQWLGVRDEPSAEDIIETVSLIVDNWKADTPLDRADRHTVDQCWQALGTMLSQGAISEDLLEPLSLKRSLLDGSGRLQRPDQLLLNDDPALGSKFAGLSHRLLSAAGPTAEAAAALGALPLSQAARLILDKPARSRVDTSVSQRIAERRGLIERVLASDSGSGKERRGTRFLGSLEVIRASQVQVHYQLTVGEEQFRSPAEQLPVLLLKEDARLYIPNDDQPTPWAAIAKELAAALKGDRAVGGLAIGIKEVLTAESAAAASAILDELGYL